LEIGTVRIIAGISRGRRVTVPGVPGVRPTLSRIREPLFTMLGEDLVDGDVLDLFAGSGALGIEALSRGARHAVFVDENPLCLRAIRENLERCGFQSQTEVLRGRLPAAFRIVGRALLRKADIVLSPAPSVLRNRRIDPLAPGIDPPDQIERVGKSHAPQEVHGVGRTVAVMTIDDDLGIFVQLFEPPR
jgi:hypothetical protein